LRKADHRAVNAQNSGAGTASANINREYFIFHH
jgi:hypothetical protein